MSYVTNMVIIHDEPELFDEHVNGWEYDSRIVQFGRTNHTDDDRYGGQKFLEWIVEIGAFNHLPIDAFVEHLQSLPWRYQATVSWAGEDVQVGAVVLCQGPWL